MELAVGDRNGLDPWQQFVADYRDITGGRRVLDDMQSTGAVSVLFEFGREVELEALRLMNGSGMGRDAALRAAIMASACRLAAALGHG